MLPREFVGVWTRTELVLDGTMVAEAGAVFWIQGPTAFVDVRAPGGPGNDTAFAGTTAWRDGRLIWRHIVQREADLRADTAAVHFEANDLIEEGTNLFGARVYRERRVKVGGGASQELIEPGLVAVRHGDHAAAVMDRRSANGRFGACYWRGASGCWEPVVAVGEPGGLPAPDGNLFAPEAPVAIPMTGGGGLAELVRQAIVVGRYAPGDRLTEERLASEFGVSRSPVREALRSLAGEGFVESGHYAGTFVARLQDDEVEDLLEVRAVIESLVARRAALRRKDEQVVAMRTTIGQAWLALNGERYDDLVMLNGRFHATLAEASGNPTLNRLVEQLRAKIAWVYSADVRERANYSWDEHEAIVDAVASGDGDVAAARARDHVQKAMSAYARRPRRPR